MRIAVLQRVCPGYRRALFSALSGSREAEVRLFIGDDLPNSKVRSAPDLGGINVMRLKTRFVKLGHRTFPWHVDLIDALRKYDPDVILCEGESHFIGYLQAIYYRLRHSRRTALMHWCFISLPGESNHRRDPAGLIKGYFRRWFDAFVVYSSYSRDRLLELGEPANKVFVATNVGDVRTFLASADRAGDSKAQARQRLGMADRFTVLYAGSLDANKRPEMLLDLAASCDPGAYNFVLLGSGPLLEPLRKRTAAEGLSNVLLPGRTSEELTTFYRAADVLIVPGRGGIVMSEAMAAGLPVVVHEADGTEYDLVVPGVSGIRVPAGGVNDFQRVLESLRAQPEMLAAMGANSRRLVQSQFTEANMVQRILEASRFAQQARRGHGASAV